MSSAEAVSSLFLTPEEKRLMVAAYSEIHETARVSAHAVIEPGCVVGPGAFIGHHCVLRPGTKIGADAVIGHGTVFEGECSVGARTLIHAQCHITAGALIEGDVFIAPLFVGANDAAMVHGRRHVKPFDRTAYVIRKGARIAVGVTVLPGVEIGANAVIGAGSLVTRDVPANSVAFGSPARIKGQVPEEERL